ncbi:unnamed protein product [Closterium sp. NIES-53]
MFSSMSGLRALGLPSSLDHSPPHTAHDLPPLDLFSLSSLLLVHSRFLLFSCTSGPLVVPPELVPCLLLTIFVLSCCVRVLVVLHLSLFSHCLLGPLVAAIGDFAATHRLDYTTRVVTVPPTHPRSAGGEPTLGCDVLEDSFKAVGLSVGSGHGLRYGTLEIRRHLPQRDYELHALDFSNAFLRGCLHEEIWLRRPPGFTGTFLPGTQVTLAKMKSELQKRYTCTDLGELRRYLGLQITKDRAARTITLSESHTVQQVLLRFGFQFSTTLLTPLVVDHGLTDPFPDEPFESNSPYAELVGCLMYTRSSSVAQSIAEAKINAGAMAVQKLCWLKFFFIDLGERPSSAPTLFADNKAMILLCREP